MSREKGITLIALVITIIVLLILAGVSISLVLGDNGIIKQSTNAVEKNRESTAKEEVEIAWASAESDYWSEWANNSALGKNAEFYDAKLKQYLSPTGHDISVKNGELQGTYIINYTSNNQDIPCTFIADSNGNISKRKTLEDYGVKFGDYINYDEGTGYSYTTNPAECASNEWPEWSVSNYNATKNGYVFSAGTFTTENLNWRVLGVSDNGNLELISEYPTSAQLYLGGKIGYINSEKILNDLCNALYGKGKFADSARSLKNEDIYKLRGITEMNSTLYNEYGIKYQFKYENSDSALMYRTASPSTENWTEWTSTSYDGFYTPKDGLVVGRDKRGTSDIIFCDYVTPYFWNENDLIDQIIYCNSVNNSNTWLASKGIWKEGDRVSFPVSSSHGNRTLYASNNEYSCMEAWIRPVATLKLNVTVDTSSTTGENAQTAYKLKQ